AGDGDVGGAKRARVARRRGVRVAPDAAGVVREEMNGDGGRGRRRADAMDVVARRNQRVEVARLEGASLHERELAVLERVDLLVLRPAIEADEAPREVVVHGCLRAGRDDEAEERERGVAGA